MKKFTNFGVENWWLDLSVGFLGGRIGGGGVFTTICSAHKHSISSAYCLSSLIAFCNRWKVLSGQTRLISS